MRKPTLLSSLVCVAILDLTGTAALFSQQNQAPILLSFEPAREPAVSRGPSLNGHGGGNVGKESKDKGDVFIHRYMYDGDTYCAYDVKVTRGPATDEYTLTYLQVAIDTPRVTRQVPSGTVQFVVASLLEYPANKVLRKGEEILVQCRTTTGVLLGEATKFPGTRKELFDRLRRGEKP
jgi:hypothetical protein